MTAYTHHITSPRKLLTALLLCLSLYASAGPVWERVDTDRRAEAAERVDMERVDIEVRQGYVYITCNRPTQVKVFTILGQPVSETRLNPGTSRLKLNGKGVYILRAGGITRRITV